MVDWNSPSICLTNCDGCNSLKKSDFAMKLNALVEAGESTGIEPLTERSKFGITKLGLSSECTVQLMHECTAFVK